MLSWIILTIDISVANLVSVWYLLPIAILIAAVAMTFGIGGAIFFSPFFIIVMGLPPETAIALGIIIEVFGFSSGVYGYSKSKLINYHLSFRLIIIAVTGAVVGAFMGKAIPPIYLELLLAIALFILAIAFLRKEKESIFIDHPLHPEGPPEKKLHLWAEFWQDYKKKPVVVLTSAVGGFFVGLISAGLGEINEYNFVKRLKMSPGLSAGSSVLVVAVTALSVTIFNVSYFAVADPEDLTTIFELAVLAIPGVIIGAQIGVRISKKIDRKKALKVLPWLFIFIGVLTIVKAFII